MIYPPFGKVMTWDRQPNHSILLSFCHPPSVSCVG